MSLNFRDSFDENYQMVDNLYKDKDLWALQEYREMLFAEEGCLTVQRIESSVKEKILINLQISDIHNLMALSTRRIHELREDEC